MILYIILGAVGLFILFGIIGTVQEKMGIEQKPIKKRSSSSSKIPSVSELVANVENIADFRKLKAKFERAENSYANNHNENPNIDKRYKIYEDAFYQACKKTLYYQFVPDLDIYDQQDNLDNAFKLFTVQELSDDKKKVNVSGNIFNSDKFVEVTAEDYVDKNYETKPSYWSAFVDFQKTLSDETISNEIKASKIQTIANRNKDFANEFFYGIKSTEIGQVWMKEQTE